MLNILSQSKTRKLSFKTNNKLIKKINIIIKKYFIAEKIVMSSNISAKTFRFQETRLTYLFTFSGYYKKTQNLQILCLFTSVMSNILCAYSMIYLFLGIVLSMFRRFMSKYY